MDYAIVEISGKQFKVEEGRFIDVDLLEASLSESPTPIKFETVCLVSKGDKLLTGTPFVKGASVSLSFMKNFKDKKVIVYKQKPKKGTRLKQGHRQPYSRLMVDSISA
jgi:large subunit ribosomal protein L21